LVGRQEGHPACKNEWLAASMVISLEQGADLHMVQLMPLPLTVSCFTKIQIGFTFPLLGSPSKGALNGCMCVCVIMMTLAVDEYCCKAQAGFWFYKVSATTLVFLCHVSW